MQWVKATGRTPEPYKWVPAKTWGGFSLVSFQTEQDDFIDYKGNVINNEDIEWLDTEEPSFSISDIGAAWKHCCELWEERSGRCIPPELFHKYLIDKYNIDVDIN